MSNHFSGPDFAFPGGDPRLDITDLYVFPAPGDADKSVLIMDVHPSISSNPPGLTEADAFAPEAVYEFAVDTDGDAIANILYGVRFSPFADGVQTATVRRAEGGAATAIDGGEAIVVDAPVSVGSLARVVEAGDYRFFAGPRSDPFFADVQGALNGLRFTGTDSLAQFDVYSIVLEVPNRSLGPRPDVGVWARVLIPGNDGPGPDGAAWIQVDRAGRPEMVNFYCQGEDKNAFNAADPARDRADFLDRFAHALEHMGHYPPDEARAVAATLLPDILPYDYSRPAALPLTGRALVDDAFDQAVSVYTNQPVTDGVGPHADLLGEFPYLGAPHGAFASTAPEAAVAGAG